MFLVCDNDFVVGSSAALAKPLGLIPRLVGELICAFPRQDSQSEGPIKVTAERHTYSEKTVLEHRGSLSKRVRESGSTLPILYFFALSQVYARRSEPCLKTYGYFFEGCIFTAYSACRIAATRQPSACQARHDCGRRWPEPIRSALTLS